DHRGLIEPDIASQRRPFGDAAYVNVRGKSRLQYTVSFGKELTKELTRHYRSAWFSASISTIAGCEIWY
ncbi:MULTISPECIES: hypothetical protein, partial [unclassified Rhizobium]|uniref:hypothetical protein n=1 Tax=unclassified Rhizobium TaxID=2613769 RepID=UPI00381A8602